MRLIKGHALASGVIAVALVATAGSGAVAAGDPVEQIAGVVSDAAPDDGSVVKTSLVEDSRVATAGDVRTQLPSDPTEPLNLLSAPSGERLSTPSGEHDPAAMTEEGLKVFLPTEASLSDARVASDGTLIYESTNNSTDVAVQALSDGSTRIQTILPDASAPTQYTYTFGDGVVPQVASDGSVDLVIDSGDGVAITVGNIAAPWAVDSEGAHVKTAFSVSDGSLVQTIDADSDTAFPVVADPRLSVGVGVYIYALGAEYKVFMGALAGLTGASVVVSCAYINLPNGAWAAFLRVACSTVGLTNLRNFVNFVKSSVNAVQLNSARCYEIRRFTGWSGPKHVALSHCGF